MEFSDFGYHKFSNVLHLPSYARNDDARQKLQIALWLISEDYSLSWAEESYLLGQEFNSYGQQMYTGVFAETLESGDAKIAFLLRNPLRKTGLYEAGIPKRIWDQTWDKIDAVRGNPVRIDVRTEGDEAFATYFNPFEKKRVETDPQSMLDMHKEITQLIEREVPEKTPDWRVEVNRALCQVLLLANFFAKRKYDVEDFVRVVIASKSFANAYSFLSDPNSRMYLKTMPAGWVSAYI